jgi:undecaprenyl-diphosphatase
MPERLDTAPSLIRRAARPEFGALVAIVLLAGLLLGFGLLAAEVLEGDTIAFDRHIMAFLHPPDGPRSLGPRWLAEMMRDITALGSTIVIVMATLGAAGYLLLARNLPTALYVLGSVLGGQVVSSVLKFAVERPRPVLDTGVYVYSSSFPSGHAMLSAVTYLTLGALLTRLEGRRSVRFYPLIVSVILTGLIGVSRVYLGVHWPSDVLAGWCLGAAWAMLCWFVVLRLQQRHVVEPPH